MYIILLEKKGISFQEGNIKEEFRDNKSKILYSCYNELEDSSVRILINESNNKVIGIDISDSKYDNKGIILKEAIEEFKNEIKNLKENNKGGTIIQKIISEDEFQRCYYNDGDEIYSNKRYTINEAKLKISGKSVVIKTYYNYSNDYFELIKLEQEALSKIRNKFVIKLKDYYFSNYKSMLIFDSCPNTLKNFKKNWPLEKIGQFLIQINEAIKELDKNQINYFILSPENVCLFNGNFKLINLFPFYFLDKRKQLVLQHYSLKYINPKIHNFDNFDKKEHILFNIGALIYEMYFGELPYEIIYDNNNFYSNIKLKRLKNSDSEDFDDLIENLLNVDKNSFTWNDYINCDFLKSFSPQEKFRFLYSKENNLEEKYRFLYPREKYEPTGFNLGFNEIPEENLLLLSKMEFKNLIWLNLSNNKIENLEFITASLKNLKILSLEDNNLKNLNLGKELSNVKDLEYLFIGSNSIENINFSSKDLLYLTHLSLFNNKINNLSSLKNCSFPNLEILNLSFNKITDISYL